MPLDPKLRFLIIDDMPDMRLTMKAMLSKMGCANLDEAEDGLIGLQMIKEAHECGEPYKLILSDWNMPQMTGIELLKKLRADENLKDVAFIMVTVEGDHSNIVAAISTGIEDFILKPVKFATLESKIAKLFPTNL